MLRYKRLKQENFEESKIIFEDVFPEYKTTSEFESQWISMLKYGRIYGLFENQKMIGFCSWVHFSDENYITFCNLTVDKLLHRKGYGTKIIRYILNKVKHKKMGVVVQTNEKLFFESVDFKVVIDFEDDDTQPYRYYMNF